MKLKESAILLKENERVRPNKLANERVRPNKLANKRVRPNKLANERVRPNKLANVQGPLSPQLLPCTSKEGDYILKKKIFGREGGGGGGGGEGSKG